MIKSLAVATITALALTACAAPKAVSTDASPSYLSQPPDPRDQTPAADSNVTKVGQWATAEDGLAFRVSELSRGKVGAYAAGGNPGDPAAIVAVQIRNGGQKRFDLALVQVEARVGADGASAEQVFGGSYGEGFSGTLAPGRTATAKFMFAADSAADLKKISVEVKPDFEYDSATFEGGL